jgi:NAD(P)-dependent dehydrogenase (short-subunit alcohol dehydrogenase family)
MNLQRNTILITGGSSGIGRRLAGLFLKCAANILLWPERPGIFSDLMCCRSKTSSAGTCDAVGNKQRGRVFCLSARAICRGAEINEMSTGKGEPK